MKKEIIIQNLSNEEVFAGYTSSDISGLERARLMINGLDFRIRHDLHCYKIEMNKPQGFERLFSNPGRLWSIESGEIKDCHITRVHYGDRKEVKMKEEIYLAPQSVLYPDGGIETFNTFFHREMKGNEKSSKIYYDCNLMVPLPNSSIDIGYRHPVKNENLLKKCFQNI